ncbi:MAG TPA: hypothetical protein PLO69_11285, partial [Gammaproteobacteria bacterium]|nr:hypothetical protein [Gammaproteobacteria bacterium]
LNPATWYWKSGITRHHAGSSGISIGHSTGCGVGGTKIGRAIMVLEIGPGAAVRHMILEIGGPEKGGL